RELGMPRVLVPMSPGVTCALGLLVSDLKYDYSQTFIAPLRTSDLSAVNRIFDHFISTGRSILESEYVTEDRISFVRHLDLRYIGQSYELKIPIVDRPLTPDDFAGIESAFFADHHRTYGFATAGEPVEIVNIKVTATGKIQRPTLPQVEAGGTD